MARFQSLPPELLLMTVSLLNKSDVKSFRLLDRACCAVTTPILFEDIFFNFEPGGVDHLEEVSKVPRLAQLVRRLTLRRNIFLPEYRHFDQFIESNVHTLMSFDWSRLLDIPAIAMRAKDPSLVGEEMTRSEWFSLSVEDKRELYRQYREEYDGEVVQAKYLAFAVSLHIDFKLAETVGEDELLGYIERSREAYRTISRFEASLRQLKNVVHFGHQPISQKAYMQGFSWNRLPLALDSAGYFLGYSRFNLDIENLHLFAALYLITASKAKLTSVDVLLSGEWLLSVEGCQELLEWGAPEYGNFRGSGQSYYRMLSTSGGTYRTAQRREVMARVLTSVRKMLALLTRLKVCVCVDQEHLDKEPRDLEIVGKELSACLKRCEHLREVSIAVLGLQEMGGAPEGPFFYYDDKWCAFFPNRISASLVNPKCGANLRELALSYPVSGFEIAKILADLHSLRHLELSKTTAKDPGGWEGVFVAVAKSPHLESITMYTLQWIADPDDMYCVTEEIKGWRSRPSPETVTWAGPSGRFKKQILDFLLRRSSQIPCLIYTEFLTLHGLKDANDCECEEEELELETPVELSFSDES